MTTNRRDFLKASALAAVAAAMPEGLKAAVAGRDFKKITIAKTSCQFEREPMVRPFGFKGGYLTEEWIVSAYVRSTSGLHGIGLGTQSSLWSDAKVFAENSEAGGNAIMFAMTQFALKRLVGQTFTSPVELNDWLWPQVWEYGKKVAANPALRAGAKLELDPGMRAAVEKAVAVWKPGVSIDQGRHGDTHAVRELCSDPQSSRTPFVSGPEFMQWIVPNAFYSTAYVLCADIPQKDRVPKVGLSVTRFGEASVGSKATSFVSLEGAATNRSIRAVGTLSYRRDGKAEKATVYLVKVPINPLAILQYVNDLPVYGKDGKGRLPRMLGNIGDYLDFEFVGAGTGDWNPRSSVQILGCSLAQMDYGVEMDQSVRGNLFERVSGSALVFPGDAQSWYTTGACTDVLVEDNVFRDNLTSRYQYTEGIISIFPEVKRLAEQKQGYHCNIVVRHNRFETFDVPLLYARSADGVHFDDNEIIYDLKSKYQGWGKKPFRLDRVKNFTFERNEVKGRGKFTADDVEQK